MIFFTKLCSSRMINQVREKISGSPEEVEANRLTLRDAFNANKDTLKFYSAEMKKLINSLVGKNLFQINNFPFRL